MPQREQTHVDNHISGIKQKEDNPNQKQQVVVTGNHVFGTDVHEGDDCGALIEHQKLLGVFIHPMSKQ